MKEMCMGARSTWGRLSWICTVSLSYAEAVFPRISIPAEFQVSMGLLRDVWPEIWKQRWTRRHLVCTIRKSEPGMGCICG